MKILISPLLNVIINCYLGIYKTNVSLPSCITCLFKKRSEVESSMYLQDDRLIIECNVTIFKESRVFETISCPKIQVPPSDIIENLGKLLETGKGSDVMFSVGGQTFMAHKFVLAMWSPCITIEEMQPSIFNALLYFIYTNSLPAMDDIVGGDRAEMIRHMLVAANRFAMGRLKLMCQSMLCDDLNVQNVATTLALVDQHHCDTLMDACIEFISSSTMDDVVATKGFVDLKRRCPSVLVDAFVRMSKQEHR
ncbi:hypothetical protein SETIT_8G145900v2 [Setaria italica]|uniref:BTB domain-containing protein n=1 Tax=Setaria italica TaxID=4555 RepID=A0A368S7R7_SETIT|nr:hypothetical protein SETIT_8G145900v2 [Setaria italica]